MPIYEYRCQKCGKTSEKITTSTKHEITCPFCGATAKRIVSLCSGNTAGNKTGGSAPISGCG